MAPSFSSSYNHIAEEERLQPFFLVSDSVIVPNLTSINAYMSGLYPEQTSSSFSPFYLNPTFMHVEPCPIITTQQFTHHPTNSSSMETELHQVDKGEIKGKLKHAKQKRKKKVKAEKKSKVTPQAQAAPTDYVHVRARRGQATDSHSLAERARREKISQKMKFLQSLVPGCDKINGKALILDEIIDYIQSLQNQVEFLAAKLSSVYPIFSDFEIELESNKLTTEKHYTSMDPDLTYLIQSDSFQLGSIVDPTPTSNSLSFRNGVGSSVVLPISKDDEDLLWDVENQKTKLASLYGLNHSGSNQIYHLPTLY